MRHSAKILSPRHMPPLHNHQPCPRFHNLTLRTRSGGSPSLHLKKQGFACFWFTGLRNNCVMSEKCMRRFSLIPTPFFIQVPPTTHPRTLTPPPAKDAGFAYVFSPPRSAIYFTICHAPQKSSATKEVKCYHARTSPSKRFAPSDRYAIHQAWREKPQRGCPSDARLCASGLRPSSVVSALSRKKEKAR
jgi:hypothetical protein